MADLGWREAIIEVLQQAAEPMHYTDIADEISNRSLRADLGATPANSVNATISQSLANDTECSPFVRVGRGYYALRSSQEPAVSPGTDLIGEEQLQPNLINAFGMYWARNYVDWNKAMPKILGRQQAESKEVDFAQQRGVYLLYDGRAVVYVGRTTDQPLAVRLRQHTKDRLTSRWDRFSWFGVYGVLADGRVSTGLARQFDPDALIATMEALLIEGLEPPQNRKRGDEFMAVEFLQAKDPDLEREESRFRIVKELFRES